jgi:membrane protein DedA with SNARE-associated domain
LELFSALNPLAYVTTYYGIVILIYLTSFGLPIPEEMTLILAGAAAHEGAMHMRYMVPLAAFTILVTDFQIYLIGRYFGRHILSRWPFRRLISSAKIDAAEKRFAGHTIWAVFTVRFISGLRWPTYFSAGTLRMPVYKFVLVELVAVTIHATTYSFVGYIFSPHVFVIVEFVKKANKLVGLTAILALVLLSILIGYRLGKRKKIGDDAPAQ